MVKDDHDAAEVPPTPLSVLLQSKMDQNGWTLRDVTRPPDGIRPDGPARSTFSYYLQPGHWLKTMPRRKALDELASVIGLDIAIVAEIAWQSTVAYRETQDASGFKDLRLKDLQGESPRSVVPPSEDDAIRFRRPAGMTDAEWRRIKGIAERQIRALFEDEDGA